MDDVQIINLYFARDENAIAETKNKYENMCYSVAHNILYNREDSEECVNDTWFFTWNSIPPKRPSILASFVSKIGNIIASDIETYLRKKEIIDIFDAFLGTLSERDRDIFVRRYWYMDSIKRIADRHNCGESRIKSILARSRKKLYYVLTEAGYAE